MNREELNALLAQIRQHRQNTLTELNDLSEADFRHHFKLNRCSIYNFGML